MEMSKLLQGELKGAGADKARARAVVNEFLDWATKEGLEFPAPLENDALTLEAFAVAIEHHRTPSGGWSKNGESALHWAKELLRRSREVVKEREEALEQANHPKEPQHMPKQPEEMDEMDEMDEEYEDDGSDEGSEEEEEAPPEPKRRKPKSSAGVQQPIIVQMPAQAAKKRGQQTQQQAQPTLKGLLPRMEKIRLFKRDERGKRVLIDDYSIEDLAGQKLTDFIEEVVHPRFANEGVPTEYIAFEVDARTDREKGPPFRHVIEDDEQPQQGNPNDPFRQVHQAMGLLRELQGGREEPQEKNPAIQALQQKAASTGDMQGVITMMLLEKVFNQQQRPSGESELLMKILDRLEGKGPRGEVAPMQPPVYMPPPPPAPVSGAMDKVMELAVAKLAAPPPSTFEMAKELASVQQLLTGGKSSEDVTALRAELRDIRNALAAKPQGGLEKDLETFEKVTTMVKSIAPQVNADGSTGGIAGFIKNILTPDVAKAIAGAVGALPSAGQQGAPAPGITSQQVGAQPQAPQQPQPPPRDPNQPPRPPPQAVVEAAKAFQMAQTPPARAEKFADFIIAMFASGDPYYQQMLSPVVQELSKQTVGVEELKPARRLCMMLIAEQKPDWATPEFVDVVLASLASKVGIDMPGALAATAGAWTLDFKGSVIMLEKLAKPVQEEPVVEKDVSAVAAAEQVLNTPPPLPSPVTPSETVVEAVQVAETVRA